jgi:cell division protein FtsZ
MINIRMNNVDHNSKKLSPKITVIGVGGAGGNAVNNMISSNLNGVDFVVCNTDAQALLGSLAEHKVQLGTLVTEGLGAGAKPEIGRAAAEESLDDVMQYLEDANMAFITAGMGGGTGTGAAAVIAKACRERGILTVGVVTKPFHFEGSRRMKMAEEGLSELQSYVDTLIVIPNQNLFRVVNDKTTFADGFKMADSVLQSAVRGVTDLIVMPGLINLDFADIRSVMQEMGKAVMGAGEATGDNRAIEAAEKAISNPLLDDVSMKGAKGVIVNITGGYDMTLFEVDEACNRIRDEVDPDANIIFGSTFDEALEGTIRVSVVATGIDAATAEKRSGFMGARGLVGAVSSAPRTTRPSVAMEQPRMEHVAPVAAPAAKASFPKAVQYAPMPAPVAQPVQQPMAQPVYQQPMEMAQQPQQMVQPVMQPAPQEIVYGRGARVGEAFIPPQPVEVMGGNGYASQIAQSPAYQVQAQAPADYYETHQQPAPQARRKSPSLFERITSGYRRAEPNTAQADDFLAPTEHPQARTQQRMGPAVAQQQPAQGRLNIDVPAGSKADEDELDIPAFLRRQTS